MTENRNQFDIDHLLILLLENDLTDAQRNELIRWSRTDPEAASIYHDILRDYSIIGHEIGNGIEYGPSSDTEFDRSLWSALSEYEKAAPSIHIPPRKPQPELIQKVEHKKHVYQFTKSNYISVLVSAAAIMIVAVVLLLPPRASYEAVARILNSSDSKWHQDHVSARHSLLMKGPLEVTEGIFTFAMYDGTKIVLTAPATADLEQINQLYLKTGLMQAVVPPDASGFTVRTPHGCVVDYGTEFSVEVNRHKQTLVEVFKGIVELRDSSDPFQFTHSQKLTMGQKGQIDATGEITWTNPALYANDEIRVQWQCPNPTGLWDDPSWWSQGLVRGPDIVAEFRAENAPKTIVVDDSMTGTEKIYARRADVGLVSPYPVTVRMDGGQVQLEQLWIGRMGQNETAEGRWVMSDGELVLKGRDAVLLLVGDECKGYLIIHGGRIEIFGSARIGGNEGLGNFAVSEGTLEMNAGEVSIYGLLEVSVNNSRGTLYLNGGRIHAFDLRIGQQGSLIMTGGVLVLEGNKTASIENMISIGKIQSPAAPISVAYDMDGRYGFGSDKTVITITD